MKRRRICISVAASAVALAGCLFPAFASCSASSGKIEPTGTNVRAVQFDAVIELNRYSPRSLRHDYTVIFARYWVARDCYAVAVVWAEPQSMDMFLSVRPPGLSIASNQQSFSVRQESIRTRDEPYKKPLEERGVFRCMFGSYPVDNVRFAQAEALRTRVYARDLGRLKDANHPGAEAFDVSIPAAEGADARDVARLKISATGGRIDSLEIFDAKHQLLKTTSYEYDSKEGSPRLCQLTAILPQRPMTVGFNTGGMKVTLDGKEYRYKDLEATHHAGGRRCTVQYEPVTLSGKKVPLPVRVTVRGGKDDKTLRSVRIMNFKKVELDATGAKEAARQFGAVTPEERQYEQLRLKYRNKAPTEIEDDDVAAIRQLRAHFENNAFVASESTGGKLKRLNILMELSLMPGDVPALERHYERYLSTLHENELLQMMLVGGYGVIETATFRGRRSEAEKLLSLWVKAVVDMHADESILLFARRQLAKNRLWPTAALLEAFLSKKDRPAEARFEAEALRCTALAQLRTLLQTEDIAKKGLMAEVQADWVTPIGKAGLDEMLAQGINQAKSRFAELFAPTESQQAVVKQLDEIDQKTDQAKNE
jgi:hypothetical protein